MALNDFFKYGSVFSPVIPLLFAWQKLNRYQVVIVIFIACSFFSDLFSLYIFNPRGGNYHFLQLYGIIEACLLFYFYSLVLKNARTKIIVLLIGYGIFYSIDSFTWEAGTFNSYARVIECLFIVSFSLMLFLQFYKDEDDIFIEKSPLFWFNVALLTYFAGAFFSFILSKYFLPGVFSWKFHNSANMLKNIIMAIGLWKLKRP